MKGNHIIRHKESLVSLKLHDDTEFITLSQYIDFKKNDQLYVQSMRDYIQSENKDDSLIDREALVRAVHLVTQDDTMLDQEFDVITKVHEHYIGVFNRGMDPIVNRINEKTKGLELEESLSKAVELLNSRDLSLEENMRLILMVSTHLGICNATDENYSFDYQDETYYVGSKDIDSYYNDGAFKAGQVAIVQNVRKLISERIKEKTDIEGLFEMELSLYEIAALALKKGEKLPYFSTEQSRFLQERGEHFKGMMTNDYYNLCFFLTTYLLRSAKTMFMQGISKTFGKDSGMTAEKQKTLINLIGKANTLQN